MLLNDRPVSAAEASQQSALTLAYLGDAVFELLVREMLVINSHKTNGKLHFEATHFVSAKAQSEFVDKIMGIMTTEELAVYKRGRNSDAVPPKNTDVAVYQRATGLETLFGYLYLSGKTERIEELFELMVK